MKKPKILAPTARQVVRNLLVLADGTVMAGYRMGQARWDFTGDPAKMATMDAVADVYGQLGDRTMIERVVTRPHPVQAWAANLDLRTPNPAPDVPGETWNNYLARMQRRIASTGMDDKIVYRYFSVGKVKPKTDVRAIVLHFIDTGQPVQHEGVKAVLADEKRVADIVTGWNARRMNEREQAWLRIRSLAPGVTPPDISGTYRTGWDEYALPALANDVRWEETPFGRTVTIRAFRDGKRQDRAVMILTAARVEDLRYPANGLEPWMTYAERAVDADGVPFPVEWCVVGTLKTGAQMAAGSELALRLALNMQEDYADHGEPPPATTERAIAVAKSTRDQVTTGQASAAGRFVGTVNAIITGEAADGKTAEEVVEERAAAFIRLYAGNDLRMEFTIPMGQSVKLLETVPGEPFDRLGYQRQIRFGYLAAGLPTVSTTVGDGMGPYIGCTRGASRRPVFHDPWYATEGQGVLGRSQNMWVIAGTLGAGKSMLMGAIAYHAARRGTRVIVRDPSGQLSRLTKMPELEGISLDVNLLDGQPGILSPPALIREPLPSDFDEPGQWAAAVKNAKAERRELIIDMARRCLDHDLYDDPHTKAVLREAARKIEWYTVKTMWDLMIELSRLQDPHADAVGAALGDASTAPLLSLLFPTPGEMAQLPSFDATLTVISTPGIRRAPDEISREDWNPNELGADVVLRLTALFTDRLIFSKERNERAVLILDEAEDLTDNGPGRGFLQRVGRDHSKWNTAVYLGVKSISEHMFSGELRNFLAGAFVGKMATIEPAIDMLAVLNVADKTYAQTLMRLSRSSPGEFVHLDADGNIGGVRVDVDYHPELKAALLTTPVTAGSQYWIREDAL